MLKKLFLWALMSLLALAVVSAIIDMMPGAIDRKKTEQQRYEKQLELSKLIFPVVETLKQNAKNPDSVKVEKFGISSDNTVCIIYRATNSFNAVVAAVAYERKNVVKNDDAGFKKFCNTPMVEYSQIFHRQP